MTTESKHIPNYLAYFILLVVMFPIFWLEFNPGTDLVEGFYPKYKSYYTFVLFFQVVLFGFVCAKSIIQYDQTPMAHRPFMLVLNFVLGSALIFQVVAWLGYFVRGLYFFEWLNQQ